MPNRLKDPDSEELRHTLAHLWCALEALVDAQADLARRHLVDCEAAIFAERDLEEDLDDGAHTLPQEGKTEGQQAEAEESPEAEKPRE